MPRTDHCAASVASCPPKPRSLGVWTFRCAGIQSEVSRFLGVSLRRFQVFCHKSERGARAKLGRNMVAQAATASAAELTSSADDARSAGSVSFPSAASASRKNASASRKL